MFVSYSISIIGVITPDRSFTVKVLKCSSLYIYTNTYINVCEFVNEIEKIGHGVPTKKQKIYINIQIDPEEFH